MMTGFGTIARIVLAVAVLAPVAAPAAQIRTVDPSAAAVGDARVTTQRGAPAAAAAEPEYGSEVSPGTDPVTAPVPMATVPMATVPSTNTPPPASGPVDRAIASEAAKPDPTNVYQDDDILGAAEGVFGRGAEGLAKAIEGVLKKQGRPNAYIAGREVGGAFVVGLRYGSGTMHHKIEGDRPVYWTGPSLGLDFGGNGAKTFVLVYNLYDSQDLFHRFPAAEGAAYLIGGFNISYLRRGDVVLIPIRLGVGWRLGANVGYMNFSEKARILPF